MRILIADDHAIVREGLRALIEHQSAGHVVVGDAEDGHAAVSECARLHADLVVVDVSMPMLDGAAATREMLKSEHPPRVIALSGHLDRFHLGEMLAAGASGYVVKADASRDLLQGIEVVGDGGVYLSPRIAGLAARLAAGSESAASAQLYVGLSPRERDVLKQIADGASTKEVAASLGTSVKTVETQRKQIMAKLQIFSVAGLTKYAVREGIVAP